MGKAVISASVSSATLTMSLNTVTLRKFDVTTTHYYLQAPQSIPEHEEVS